MNEKQKKLEATLERLREQLRINSTSAEISFWQLADVLMGLLSDELSKEDNLEGRIVAVMRKYYARGT